MRPNFGGHTIGPQSFPWPKFSTFEQGLAIALSEQGHNDWGPLEIPRRYDATKASIFRSKYELLFSPIAASNLKFLC